MPQKKEIIQHEQIYELLPRPKDSQQFTEILNWMKEDRERVFAFAKFKYIFNSFLLIGAMTLLFAASERLEAVKWFLKLLAPFLK